MKKMISFILLASFLLLAACGDDSTGTKEEIIFADPGWESVRVHNSIAQIIIEEGYDYKTDVTTGSTPATFQGLREGDIDVITEVWKDNYIDTYEEAIESGEIIEASINFDDNTQGWYVPRYVIEGDKERDIEPLAPDLKTVEDLKKYKDIFEDPEDPGKGRLISAPSGWEIEPALFEKYESYNLDEMYNYFLPGSDTAIVASLADFYNKGEGWVGYYWSPTAVIAKYDLVLLEEAPFDQAQWEKDKTTEFPPSEVTLAINSDLPDTAPEVVKFLENYNTTSELTEEALLYMEENDIDSDETAKWWMKEHEEIWTEWLPDDIAEKVKESL